MSSIRKSLVQVIITLLVLATVWFGGELYGASRCQPKINAKTLPEFLQTMPQATRYCLLQISNTQFLEVRTRRPGWSAPSGPPAYVFNKSGELIDWTIDRGDSPNYQQRWPFSAIYTDITSAEALAWIEPKRK